MSNESTFNAARAAFVPAPDDNRDCIDFYRDWCGIRAVLGDETTDRFHGAIHNSFFFANPPHTWSGIVAGLRDWCSGNHPCAARQNRKPFLRSCYDSPPPMDIEGRAREIFNAQYRNAFPRRRINSRHALDKWMAVKASAVQMAQDDYDEAARQYEQKLAEITAYNARITQEYLESEHEIALIENLSRGLIQENHPASLEVSA
jgi:hypothetical protein